MPTIAGIMALAADNADADDASIDKSGIDVAWAAPTKAPVVILLVGTAHAT